ncbi:transposase [Bernardetia litoralis]|uniref:transposase n=1 Tax=Bernardetia litoralis TaxID=999 RepID=UPI000308A6B5|nr:transposase [Bernardetia litoralis]
MSKQEAEKGNYQALSELTIADKSTVTVYLKGVDFPLTLVKQVFKNKDESEGILYLVSSKEELDFEQITTLYKKRWKVEEHHKSIKSNLNYSKSPAYKPKTQQNHCVMCLVAFFEWECICKKLKTNHFELKYKIYINALKMAFQQIEQMKQKLKVA